MFQPTVLNNRRSGALDVLRFLAVLTVFFSHYTDTYNYVYQIVPENFKYIPVFKYGGISLMAFFMVSGYVVTMTSMKKNIKDFIVIRLCRLYPLFWISCIVAFILPRLVEGNTFIFYSSFKTLLINMTMFPTLVGVQMINPVYHTLLIELIFYVFIAIFIQFKLWNRMLPVIGALTVYCIILGLNTNNYHHFFIPPFAAGILFYYLKSNLENSLHVKLLILLNFISALMISPAFVKYLAATSAPVQIPDVWVVGTIITTIYLLFYLIITDKIKINSNKITIVLGEIAYPFYLFHIYFLALYWYLKDRMQADLLLFSILFFIVILSWVINNLIEKPLNQTCVRLFYGTLNLFKNSITSKKTGQ